MGHQVKYGLRMVSLVHFDSRDVETAEAACWLSAARDL